MSSSADGRRDERSRAHTGNNSARGACRFSMPALLLPCTLGIALGIALALAPCPAFAQEGGWATAGAFGNMEPGGRGAALGGALAPIVDDATAAHWNPARLVELDRREVAVTYADLFGLHLARHTALFFAFPRRERDLSWDESGLRARSGRVTSAYGLGLQTTNVDLDPESYAEYDLSAAYARRGLWDFTWALALHGLFARSEVDIVGASGFSIDLSLARSFGRVADASLVARGLVSRLDWDAGAKEDLRPTVEVGGALRPRADLALPAVAQFDLEASQLTQASVGAEWRAVGDLLRLRAGLRWRDDGASSGMRGSAGAGLHWKDLTFDYGLAIGPEDLGDTHRLSLQYRF
ncbi:MAG: hypothetical protein KBD56_02910 [Candidatus Eisenbacteria bacterium]|nr:hypothetical protein [Candidatus Eisenbacteria bacterium]